jgi:hypothetical protein
MIDNTEKKIAMIKASIRGGAYMERLKNALIQIRQDTKCVVECEGNHAGKNTVFMTFSVNRQDIECLRGQMLRRLSGIQSNLAYFDNPDRGFWV